MTDDELEQRLHAHYQVIDPTLAPPGLGRRIDDSLDRRSSRPAFRTRTRPAFAVVVAAVLIVAVGLGLRPGGYLSSAGSPSPNALPSAPRPTSQASGSSPAPTPLPPGPDVQAGGLLDATHGWALTGQRLLVTADGGSTWRNVTPPGGFGSDLGNPKGVAFLDAQHGWVAISEAFTSASDPSYGRIDVWRTTDGGQTWTKAQLPKAVFNQFGEILPQVQFDFLDASHGFAFLSGNLAKGRNDSDLFWTADGGRTWSADRPTGNGNEGIEGTVGFATANDGVIVNAHARQRHRRHPRRRPDVDGRHARPAARIGWRAALLRPAGLLRRALGARRHRLPDRHRLRQSRVSHARRRIVVDRCGDAPGRCSARSRSSISNDGSG